MQPDCISIVELLRLLRKNQPAVLIDVRSPAEYAAGHIPAAFNLPLLNDDERQEVGIIYKRQGRDAAVFRGFERTAKKIPEYILQAQQLSPQKELFLYCWRGGMRSQIMGWLLNTAGLKVTLLQDGYKSYRRWCGETFSRNYHFQVVGGLTGCGKTEILQALTQRNQAVIDLEQLAHHRGSSFGSLGQLPPPTQEQFENQLAESLDNFSNHSLIWIEDESRFLGRIKIPDRIFDNMKKSPLWFIERPKNMRIKRIMSEYGHFPIDSLEVNTANLAKRMGGEQVKKAIEALRNDEKEKWIELLLHYYDKTYMHAFSQYTTREIKQMNVETDDSRTVANKLIELSLQAVDTAKH